MCDSIVTTTDLLAPEDQPALMAVIHYSFQARYDYIISTNLPSMTAQLQTEVDRVVSRAYYYALNFNPLEDPDSNAELHDKQFSADRFQTKISKSGGGWRKSSNRIGYANMLNQTAPQMVDRIGADGEHIPGLWNSMSRFLGNNSFDDENKENRWSVFLSGDTQCAVEFRNEYDRLQALRSTYLDSLQDSDALLPSPLDSSLQSFGHGIQKLQKEIFDYLGDLAEKNLLVRARLLSKDDPRRMSYVATRRDKFSNTLLTKAAFSAVTAIKFSNIEFTEAVATKFGLPSPICSSLLGTRIINNANNLQLVVDKYGYNLKTVLGAKGDHVRKLHDSVVNLLHTDLSKASICHKGGFRNTVKDIFSACINAEDNINADNIINVVNNEEDRRKLQGIIPDLLINGNLLHPPSKPNPYFNCETLCDVKTLAPGSKYKVSASIEPGLIVTNRGNLVNTQYHQVAKKLDSDFNGTRDGELGPVTRKLRSYGGDGTVRGLVCGAYGEFSPDVLTLRNMISSHAAGCQLAHINIPLHQAKAIRDMKLTASWGLHLSRGWARLLLDRRNDLTNNPFGANPREQFTEINQNDFEYYHLINGIL